MKLCAEQLYKIHVHVQGYTAYGKIAQVISEVDTGLSRSSPEYVLYLETEMDILRYSAMSGGEHL